MFFHICDSWGLIFPRTVWFYICVAVPLNDALRELIPPGETHSRGYERPSYNNSVNTTKEKKRGGAGVRVWGGLMMVNEQSESNLACFKTSSSAARRSHFTQFRGIALLSGADSQTQLVGLTAN